MQFHPINHGGAVDMNTAAAGFGDAPLPPHVAQRSRRDKLRFPVPGAAADAMLAPAYEGYDDAAFPPPPPPDPSYVARASAADLGYLHAVVSPPHRPAAAGEQWPTPPQYDSSGSGSWAWARPLKMEHDEGEARAGFAAHHQGAAALSLTLQSPGTQELPQAYGDSLQSVVGAAAGPLCRFTGYAAVLKGSRFLRPAQQLLDEICAALVGSERSCWSAGAGGSCSLASPSSLSSSTDTGDRQHHRPEFREKKTKLLYMQEEVCRRYKQYHQQMQMVVSSFESIPGLSSATPHASSVLKAISRHFRRVRSGISSQIQYISRLLGEELLSLPSCSRGGKALARLGLTEQSQPVWRSQRGLPERAVSVLRAWLFDHFLHPYPTDADKHMLATQTGLTRNQVSNWFINARVRLWKPMVEEIHMLETRGAAITNAPATASSSDRVAPPVGVGVGVGSHHQHKYQLLQEQQQCLDVAPPIGVQVGGGDQVVMSFGGATPLPEMGGGFGAAAAVLLMLGLRRDVSYQQQQHYQQQFGGHILGDLVG